MLANKSANAPELILAAEECSPKEFSRYHTFSEFEADIIGRLIAHGPVLLRGGRGSGKSALMIEAHNRIRKHHRGEVFGCYLSLRSMPLVRDDTGDYEASMCQLIADAINQNLAQEKSVEASFILTSKDLSGLQAALMRLVENLKRRIVILIDDAAHIAREASLAVFFDIFRTISTQFVSCKASIYPGVTKFGARFDIYNDATVIDLNRDERRDGFAEFFLSVMRARFPSVIHRSRLTKGIDELELAMFLGRAVVGNMRAFVFTASELQKSASPINLLEIQRCLLHMASEYYWPLLEEVTPKLGMYEPLARIAQSLAERIFINSGKDGNSMVLIHREYIQSLSKVFEILEYAGYMVRRESSRAMKSGGRGVLFALNLCNVLEHVAQRRLTLGLFSDWISSRKEPIDFHINGGALSEFKLPEFEVGAELGIFQKDISILGKSKAYPYGLTLLMVSSLKKLGLRTVGDLADASDNDLWQGWGIGPKKIKRIRDVVGQAVWM